MNDFACFNIGNGLTIRIVLSIDEPLLGNHLLMAARKLITVEVFSEGFGPTGLFGVPVY